MKYHVLSCCIMLLLFVVGGSSAYACLEEYSIQSNATGSENKFGAIKISYSQTQLIAHLAEVKTKMESSSDFRHENDYAVTLLKLGKVAEGLELLKDLHEEHPEEALIACNLGSAHELNNNLVDAILQLKKAESLNPKLQNGSLWAAIKILKGTMNVNNNPAWITQNSIIGWDRATLTFDGKKVRNKKVAIQKTKQLEYQVKYRFPITKQPNSVMANLLSDLALLYEEFLSRDEAIKILSIALLYEAGDKEGIQNQIVGLRKKAAFRKQNDAYKASETAMEEKEEEYDFTEQTTPEMDAEEWDAIVDMLLKKSSEAMAMDEELQKKMVPPVEAKASAEMSKDESSDNSFYWLLLLPFIIVGYIIYVEVAEG